MIDYHFFIFNFFHSIQLNFYDKIMLNEIKKTEMAIN